MLVDGASQDREQYSIRAWYFGTKEKNIVAGHGLGIIRSAPARARETTLLRARCGRAQSVRRFAHRAAGRSHRSARAR